MKVQAIFGGWKFPPCFSTTLLRIFGPMMPIHGVNEWSELVLNTLVKTQRPLKLKSRVGGIFLKNICAMVKNRYIGDGHPTFNRNPYNGYINPYYWVDDHPLLYGNNGSLDPGTSEVGKNRMPKMTFARPLCLVSIFLARIVTTKNCPML